MARVTIDNWTDDTVWDAVHTINDGAYKIVESDEGDFEVFDNKTGAKILEETSWHFALSGLSHHIDETAVVREP